MTSVARLVTFAELAGHQPPSGFSVEARFDAELTDGRRVVLLSDRGWGGSGPVPRPLDEIELDARTVVGPDEDEDEDAFWDVMAQLLGRRGVAVTGAELRALRHDVELGERLRGVVG